MKQIVMKKFLKHPLAIAIISGLLLAPIGNAIYDHTKNIPVLTDFILKPLSLIWGFLISLLLFKISLWICLILIIAIIGGLAFFISLYSKKILEQERKILSTPTKPVKSEPVILKQPDFLQYKKDNIKKWMWSWEYKDMGNGNYSIENLKAHCPDDDTVMTTSSINFVCPRCDKNWLRPFMGETSMYKQTDNIKILISDNVRKKFDYIINVP